MLDLESRRIVQRSASQLLPLFSPMQIVGFPMRRLVFSENMYMSHYEKSCFVCLYITYLIAMASLNYMRKYFV